MHLQANIYLLYTTTTMMTITQWQRHKSKDIYAIERLYRDSVARFSVPIKTRYHLKTSWTSFADDFRSQSSKFSWPRRRGLRRHGTSYCSLRINTLISPDLFFKVRESRQKCTVLLLVSAKSLSSAKSTITGTCNFRIVYKIYFFSHHWFLFQVKNVPRRKRVRCNTIFANIPVYKGPS